MSGGMRVYVFVVLLALAFANWSAWNYVLEGDRLRVTFLDVGQGDSIYIETPQGHRILIDGGPNRNAAEKVGRKLPFWAKTLDLVVLTHPDADHSTGLVAVLEEYKVKNVLWTGVKADTAIFFSWEKALAAEEAHVLLARAPQKLLWSNNPREEFMEILYPSEAQIAEDRATNETSIISALVFGRLRFLFPGDVSRIVEQKLVDQSAYLDSHVLKVPHHGSKTSSSESFLAAVSPNVAIIQVGRNNRYGHPAQETLDRFEALGIPVLRTDLHGDIMVEYDPSKNRTYVSYY